MMGTKNSGLYSTPDPLSGGFVAQVTSSMLYAALLITLWSGWQYMGIGLKAIQEDRR
jgi:hypothetical protein